MKTVKSLVVLLAGAISALYLLNIGVGVVELLPDNIPLAGNLDEAIAAIVLTNALAYFGIDLRHMLGRRQPAGREIPSAPAHDGSGHSSG